ncbi:hypothetical protein EV182_006536, partial [Spiromyces aspiralis]
MPLVSPTAKTDEQDGALVPRRQLDVWDQCLYRNARNLRNICLLRNVRGIVLDDVLMDEVGLQAPLTRDNSKETRCAYKRILNSHHTAGFIDHHPFVAALLMLPDNVARRYFINETLLHQLVINSIGISISQKAQQQRSVSAQATRDWVELARDVVLRPEHLTKAWEQLVHSLNIIHSTIDLLESPKDAALSLTFKDGSRIGKPAYDAQLSNIESELPKIQEIVSGPNDEESATHAKLAGSPAHSADQCVESGKRTILQHSRHRENALSVSHRLKLNKQSLNKYEKQLMGCV